MQGKHTALHTKRTQDKTYFIDTNTHIPIYNTPTYTHATPCNTLSRHIQHTLCSVLYTHTLQCLHPVSVIACKHCRAQHHINPKMTRSRQPSTSHRAKCLSTSAQPEAQSHRELLQPSGQGPGLVEKLYLHRCCPHTAHSCTHAAQSTCLQPPSTHAYTMRLGQQMFTAPVHMEDAYTQLSIHPGVHVNAQKYKPKIIPSTQ